jgi:hypothetical protein
MGLFGSILSGLGGIVGNVIGAHDSAKAVGKASAAQIAAQQQAIAEQRREYDQSRTDYQPFLTAGSSASDQIMRLLGLGDRGQSGMSNDQVQQGALDSVHNSPLYTSTYNSGRDAVLQNAAATGGLRGGNTDASLYNLGSDTFSQVLQSMMSNLGGVAGYGIQAAGGITNAGTNAANNISASDVGIGNSQAGSILGKQAIWNNLSQQIQKSIMQAVSGGMGGGVPGLGGGGF